MGPQQKDDKAKNETTATEPKEEEKKQDSPEKKPALPGMLRGIAIAALAVDVFAFSA